VQLQGNNKVAIGH